MGCMAVINRMLEVGCNRKTRGSLLVVLLTSFFDVPTSSAESKRGDPKRICDGVSFLYWSLVNNTVPVELVDVVYLSNYASSLIGRCHKTQL